jgi:hypothetical protein
MSLLSEDAIIHEVTFSEDQEAVSEVRNKYLLQIVYSNPADFLKGIFDEKKEAFRWIYWMDNKS